jgi:hypothetical protein
LNNVPDNVARRRLGCESELLCPRLAFAKHFKGRESHLHDEFSETSLGEWFFEVVDPFCVDAVFTKQRSQISACRSGRFFVDGDFIFCHLR